MARGTAPSSLRKLSTPEETGLRPKETSVSEFVRCTVAFTTKSVFASAVTSPKSMVREFAEKLEDVVVKTVESGKMTKDLALLVGSDQAYQTTEEFLATLDENLAKALKA